MRTRTVERWRTGLRLAASALFVPMGVLHVMRPETFLPIMPPFVPRPRAVVIGTGIAEALGGIGLLVPSVRAAAGIGLAAYAVGVYPANVYHAVSRRRVPPIPDSWWYHAPRLAFQPVFVAWTLFAGGVIGRRGRVR